MQLDEPFPSVPALCRHWSGSFALGEAEQYFGLKIRRHDRSAIKIIPVNITVGASGAVLVTLKSDK